MDKMTTDIQDRGQTFQEDVMDKQTQLAVQINNVSDWSTTMSCDLKHRVLEVDSFITEEMKKDLPTG